MVLKCCVPMCNSNYATTEGTVSIYKLPRKEDDRKKWIAAIPRANIVISKYTAVCRKHWPENAEFVKFFGKLRPKHPPSVFPGIPNSCLPTQQSKERTTQRSLSSARNHAEDQMKEFLEQDKLDFDKLLDQLQAKFDFVVAYLDNDGAVIVHSKKITLGIPKFVIKIKNDFTYTCFSFGSPCNISSLQNNSISLCKTWSALSETIRYLSEIEVSLKKSIIFDQLQVTDKKAGNQKLYTPEMTTRAFEYFATSRSLYSRLQQDFQLPSIRTLTRITSKVGKVAESEFLCGVFEDLPACQRRCVILWDEIYIKPALSYHGGTLFGRATDHPDKLAKTMLAVMIKCLFGGPEFIYKVYPISNLTAKFLYDEGKSIVESIESEKDNKVIAVIADGHRTNQKCFASWTSDIDDASTPWYISDSNIFLLYDYVHVVKCLRNNWLTEKTKQLQYTFNGVTEIAKWSDLVELKKAEDSSLLKLSKLNDVAVFPKPIERQSVATCLRVFCDETIAALETHPKINNEAASGTANFFKIIVKVWKIFNVKNPWEDQKHNDSVRAVIRMSDDPRLQFLLDVAAMADDMRPTSNSRVRSLTADTAKFLAHICRGAVDLSRHLLASDNAYVMLGWFSTDPLERAFGKLRQGSGGTYFLSAQSVIEKVRIQRAKLATQLVLEFSSDTDSAGHQCEHCTRRLTDRECEVFDNLNNLEGSVGNDTIAAIIYIAGYIQRKAGSVLDHDTLFYYEKCGKYLDSLNRCNLTLPQDCLVQWCIYCLILFTLLDEPICRIFTIHLFLSISEKWQFNIQLKHCRILSNIFFKNYALFHTPRSSKEPALKVLKLN